MLKISRSFFVVMLTFSFLFASCFSTGHASSDGKPAMTAYEWDLVDIIPLTSLMELSLVDNERKHLLDLVSLEMLMEFPASNNKL
jgi:hypothetical protein